MAFVIIKKERRCDSSREKRMKILKKLVVGLLAAALMLAVVGCGTDGDSSKEANTDSQVSAGDDKIVITDSLGKTIELDGVPERVVTTIMPFPYIYYAVCGNTDTLVGCNPSSIVAYENSALKYMYPELANAETSFVDTSFVVNVEELIKLKPDVVFQWNYMDEEIEKMEAAGIKVITLQYGSLEDLYDWIDLIGKMTRNEERAEFLKDYFDSSVKEVTDITSKLSDDEIVNLLPMSDNLKVSGQGFTYYWVEAAGCKMLTKDLTGDALNVNMEQIYEWNPDLILIGNFTSMQPSDILEGKLEGQDWSVLKAVQEKQVYKIPIGGYRWDPPGVETPLMVKWVAKIAHPDLFGDMDMRQEVSKFYKDVYNFTLTDEMLDEILNDIQN